MPADDSSDLATGSAVRKGVGICKGAKATDPNGGPSKPLLDAKPLEQAAMNPRETRGD